MQQSKNKNMKTISKIFRITLAVLAIVFSFSCVFQIIKMTNEKYLVEKYQEEVNTISEEIYSASQNFEKELTLATVENMAKEKNFVQSENITYVKVSSAEVVVVR